MQKVWIALLGMIFLVSPALGQQAGKNPRGPQAGTNVAKLVNAYNRMIRAGKQGTSAAPSSGLKSPLLSVPSANSVPPGTSPPVVSTADRPFDFNPSSVNPFNPTASPPGSLSNVSPAFEAGMDPFGSGLSTANPFSTTSPSAATAFLANPADSSLGQGASPGSSQTVVANAPILRRSAQARLQPAPGVLRQGSPLSVNPYASISDSDPLGASRTLYPTDGIIPGIRSQQLPFP